MFHGDLQTMKQWYAMYRCFFLSGQRAKEPPGDATVRRGRAVLQEEKYDRIFELA